jgi:hypothetical protein
VAHSRRLVCEPADLAEAVQVDAKFDQELLANAHSFGVPAGLSPILHLRRIPGGRM